MPDGWPHGLDHGETNLNILHLAGGMNLDAGGPPRSVANSVLACLEAGLDVTLAFPDREPGESHEQADLREIARRGGSIRAFPLSVRRADLAKRYGVSLPLLRWLAAHEREFDVVHLHGAWLAGSLAAALRGRSTGGRRRRPAVVLSPHETLTRFDLDQSRSVVTRALKRLGRGTFERGTDAIVYSSELEWEDSAAQREAARPFAVHHPVDVELWPVGVPLAAAEGALRVGFLGRFHPKKNLAELIMALARVPGRAVILEVAGMGPPAEVERLRRLAAELGVGERVRWHGFVDGEARHAFLHGLDLLAMPSAYECFGMSAAEALACGVPVLAGERVGVAPVIQSWDCGFVVPPRAEPIAAALAEAARDPEGLQGRAMRASLAGRVEFSFAAHGTALRRIYEELTAYRHVDEPRAA